MYAIEPLGVCLPARRGRRRRRGRGVRAPRRAGPGARRRHEPRRAVRRRRGLVLDLSRHMRAIAAIDPDARRARVQPGVVQEHLNRAAAAHGLAFGPNTSTANRATLGGMIGNNSAGSQSIRYGMTIDHVERARRRARRRDAHPARAGVARRGGAARRRGHARGRDPPRPARRSSTATATRSPDYPRHWRQAGGYRLDRLAGEDGAFDLVAGRRRLGGHARGRGRGRGRARAGPPGARRWPSGTSRPPPRRSPPPATRWRWTPTSVELMDRTILDLSRRKLEYRSLGAILEGDPDALLFVELRGRRARTRSPRGSTRSSAAWAEHGHGYHTLRADRPGRPGGADSRCARPGSGC